MESGDQDRYPHASRPKAPGARVELALEPLDLPAPPAPAPAVPVERTRSPSAHAAARRAEQQLDDARELAARAREREAARAEALRKGAAPILVALVLMGWAAVLLHRSAAADVTLLWLAGSSLAAWGVFRIQRERGLSSAGAGVDAALVYLPFVGPGLALHLLYRTWHG